MIDERRLFEQAIDRFPPPERAFDALSRRRDRQRRNRRIGSAAVAILVALAAVGGILRLIDTAEPRPASPNIDSSNVGQLGLAWRGEIGSNLRAEELVQGDGYVFAAAMNPATFGRWSIWAFRADCATGGGPCAPLWHAAIGSTGDVDVMTFADGTLFTGGDDVLAFAPGCRDDGGVCAPTWVGRVRGSADGLLAVGGVVYAGASTDGTSGRIYAFPETCANDPTRCAPLWMSEEIAPGRFDVGRPLMPGAVGDGVLYAAPIGGPVVGSDLDMADVYTFPARCRLDGGVCTRVDTSHIVGERYVSRPAYADGMVYVGTATGDTGDEGSVRAYDASCGLRSACEVWSATTGFALNRFQPIVIGASVVVASGFHSTVQAYATDCHGACAARWTAFGDSAVASHDVVYATSGDLHEASAIPLGCTSGEQTCDPAWTGDVEAGTEGALGSAASDTAVFVGEDGAVVGFSLGVGQPGSTDNHGASPSALFLEVVALVAIAAVVWAVVWRRSRRRATS